MYNITHRKLCKSQVYSLMNLLSLNTSWSPVSSLGETALQEPARFVPPPSHSLPQRQFSPSSADAASPASACYRKEIIQEGLLVPSVFPHRVCEIHLCYCHSYRTTLPNVVANHVWLFTCKLFKIKSNKNSVPQRTISSAHSNMGLADMQNREYLVHCRKFY